jgi:hypothetical protein
MGANYRRQVILWSGCSVAALLGIVQSVLHCTVPRPLSWKHSFNLLGLPFLLAHAVLSTILMDPRSFQTAPCIAPDSPQKQSVLTSSDYHRLQMSKNSVFWTCLWALKLSNISLAWPLITDPRALFRRRRQMLYATTALTLLLYITCLVSPLAMSVSRKTVYGQCLKSYASCNH